MRKAVFCFIGAILFTLPAAAKDHWIMDGLPVCTSEAAVVEFMQAYDVGDKARMRTVQGCDAVGKGERVAILGTRALPFKGSVKSLKVAKIKLTVSGASRIRYVPEILIDVGDPPAK